jgi:hypothetical protein
MASFDSLLQQAQQTGGLETEDLRAAVLPLWQQVAAMHELGMVAPLRGTAELAVDDQYRLSIVGDARPPSRNRGQLNDVQRPESQAFQVLGEQRLIHDVDAGLQRVESLDVVEPGAPVERPVFVVGYEVWEQQIGHHDPAADIASLGLVLASLALGLDFRVPADLKRFAANRRNLFAVDADLHPVIARLIVEMAEPDRNRRAQDLRALAERLDSYRDQPVDFDLSLVAGAASGPIPGRRAAIQVALRDRLFEINRRNRLVYFTPTQQSLNVTLGSVPLLLDVRNLRAEQVATWAPPLADDVVAGKKIRLNTVLRFEDAPYLPGVLDKLISQARRDRAEYGMAQLRLVVCFLRWHNLKEVKEERINSPLLLLPIELTKKRGVRDSYVLTATSSIAEVNPALRHHLRQIYGIELPETIDLDEQSVDDLHRLLEAQIQASEPGVVLTKVDKPQLEMVHQRAKMRLDQYRRRQRAAVTAQERMPFSYSYAPGDLRPLGIQMFEQRVKYRAPERLRLAAGAPPVPRTPFLTSDDDGSVVVSEKRAYSLKEPTTGNPYGWELDLCALTIANFNYRKMTLVRDYAQLIAADEPSDSFDRIFSLDARPLDDDISTDLPLEQQHLVVPADETQRAAIARARTGRSFIIQGPPGTGKSQTITNLIADYVARGKRVLFVCEKRAAIDVVHARLRKQGLDELCAVIHDSQADKKAFIHGLKTTYESWLATDDTADAVEADRDATVARMRGRLDALRRVDAAMAEVPVGSDRSLRSLLERAAELRGTGDDDAAGRVGALPEVADWYRHADLVRQIGATLQRLGEPPVLALHPIADVRPELLAVERPADELATATGKLVEALAQIDAPLASLGLDPSSITVDELTELGALAGLATQLPPVSVAVVAAGSSDAPALVAAAEQLQSLEAAAQDASDTTAGWLDPLPFADAVAGLEVAADKEPSALKFLSGSWRAVKKTVESRYDFAGHAVAPSVTKVLTDLVERYRAEERVAEQARLALERYGSTDLRVTLRAVRAVQSIGSPPIASLRDRLAAEAGPDRGRLGTALLAAGPSISAANAAIDATYSGSGPRAVTDVRDRTERLRGASGSLRELLADLQRLHASSPEVDAAIRVSLHTADELEGDILERTISDFGLHNVDVERFTGRELAEHLAALQSDLRTLLDTNAAVVRARARTRFRQHVALAATSATQLQPEQKAFKKSFTAGRRELEHEFQKTMRYRSIRDLVDGETGPAVMDLRPIWLMSPLSVSDTLPLDPTGFDVVVFDEASQIPLEEAIPALYRSHQTIVVGDQMQLPPTQFFSTTTTEGDEVEVDDDDGQRVAIVLDGDSFLAQSAASLPSTMLAWHYRSRSEDLIGFSNAAFYGGALATVPDLHRPPEALRPITVDAALPIETAVDDLLERNVSFHFVPGAVYEARRNRAEAQYIAELVRTLLGRELGLTIGIAAFSEAQQGEIEDAIERLCDADEQFGDRFETEELREEDGQFAGLFVKNLENIQGDERDVIIMSVCYAPGPDGRMVMNFGPINQAGGEKRLNVIFSRARQHMAIVSSIRAPQITNEHNDGANALRQFLDYADALSAGENDRATRILESVNPLRRTELAIGGHSPVARALAAALRERGLIVEEDHGRSRFRCDLAVRRPTDVDHRVAVLIDTHARSTLAPVEERALTHPAVLRAFGWRVVHVLTKDWHAQPDAVIRSVEDAVAIDGE